jgi:membrane-associated protease RseP (regulator of RpoE activity)
MKMPAASYENRRKEYWEIDENIRRGFSRSGHIRVFSGCTDSAPTYSEVRAEFSASIEVPAEFVGLNPGLIAGDVIYEMNGSRIGTLEGLHTALDGKKAGAPIALLVERSGQLIYVSFELE